VDVIAWLVFGAALVLGVPGALYLAQDGILFLPQPGPVRPPLARPGRAIEPLSIEVADGITVRGWFLRAARTPAPLLVYYGGNAEEVSWQAAEPWPESWSLALVNYRGYGQSGGKPSERALFADAQRVLDTLAARADVDRARIVLVGRSLGSGVAVHVAAQRPVAGLVLISPFDSMTALGERHYPFLPVRTMLKHPFDSLARAPSITAPLLAIVGERDTIIPPEHSRRLFEAWGGAREWVVIAGAGHNDLGAQTEFWHPIGAFLSARAH
jgi:pimeloyl-ACP methyl ester carboxylesterase